MSACRRMHVNMYFFNQFKGLYVDIRAKTCNMQNACSNYCRTYYKAVVWERMVARRSVQHACQRKSHVNIQPLVLMFLKIRECQSSLRLLLCVVYKIWYWINLCWVCFHSSSHSPRSPALAASHWATPVIRDCIWLSILVFEASRIRRCRNSFNAMVWRQQRGRVRVGQGERRWGTCVWWLAMSFIVLSETK